MLRYPVSILLVGIETVLIITATPAQPSYCISTVSVPGLPDLQDPSQNF